VIRAMRHDARKARQPADDGGSDIVVNTGLVKATKIRRRLGDALHTGRVVRVWRDAYDSEFTDGIVVALIDEWVALHEIAHGVFLDGVVLMRLNDVSTVRDGHNDYIERAITMLGQPVCGFTCSPDASTRDLLKAAAELHPLTAFALGDEGDEQLMIGRLAKAGKKRLRHRFLRPDGTWAADVDRWKYRQISSIHIGGRYIDALAKFGDPYPEDDPASAPNLKSAETQRP
ncbi:MAG: hypothetical protein JWQ43_3655, partial [Glaciihabitans sp.]|nr:hypothetical protein [Glaciihabitans sp.]